MSKTPLVDSLGVFVEHAGMPGAYVSATDLEACLEKLTVVYGDLDAPKDQISWSDTKLASNTHTARLLGIQEIPKEPFIHTEGWAANRSQEHVLIPMELKGKRLKVTFEEVNEN